MIGCGWTVALLGAVGQVQPRRHETPALARQLVNRFAGGRG